MPEIPMRKDETEKERERESGRMRVSEIRILESSRVRVSRFVRFYSPQVLYISKLYSLTPRRHIQIFSRDPTERCYQQY